MGGYGLHTSHKARSDSDHTSCRMFLGKKFGFYAWLPNYDYNYMYTWALRYLNHHISLVSPPSDRLHQWGHSDNSVSLAKHVIPTYTVTHTYSHKTTSGLQIVRHIDYIRSTPHMYPNLTVYSIMGLLSYSIVSGRLSSP